MKRKTFSKVLSSVLAASLFATSIQMGSFQIRAAEPQKESDLKICFDEAAPDSYDGWEKWSLPIGNSAIGASVFGGTQTERIQLNEKSLWSGGPAKGRDYNGGNLVQNGKNGETIKEIQRLFAEGKTQKAGKLCNSLTGVEDDAGKNGYGYYLSYGNMYLDFKNGNAAVTNYKRDLDLRNAVASVEYDQNGVHYTRENFVSYPDNVLVTNITANKPNSLNFDIRVVPDTQGNGTGDRTWDTVVKDGTLSINGELKDNQLKFSSFTKVVNQDKSGTIKDGTDKITVENATSITIVTSIGTDYKNEYPNYRTGESAEELAALIKGYVDTATQKDYNTLKKSHIDDYQSIFGRVELDIGQQVSEKTTDELLAAYNTGKASDPERKYLEVMLFQYGRYLTMGSSRKAPDGNERRATLPSNLQGIWVGKNNSQWHSDYHMNVNLQMNYWPTYSTNMYECAEPLIAYVDSLREPGRKTAEIYAGIKSTPEKPENGFMAHTQNNPFGWTCPGWVFDWGWSPAAVPWIIQNCWEYYEYTEDAAFLEKNIYPMMKEQAILYDQLLVNEKTGGPDDGQCVLVSSPSYSPEHGPRTAGNTYEHSLIWQLYEDTIKAANILGVDKELVEVWKSKQARLKGPIEIGADGQIKEWYEETTLGSAGGDPYGHRHLSHMLGLFPGDLISVDNPEFLNAAKVSMRKRTDNSTGWGMGQRINTWARLGEGNKAYKLIGDLFRGGILTNLWDTHAPFQIDGNFGYTSGVAEMLMQSNMGYINLLPALPDAWANGSVRGLLARGNFEISMKWENSSVTEATILSKNGGTATVQFKNAALATVMDSKGNVLPLKSLSNDRASFETVANETYTISNIPTETLVPTPVVTMVEKSKDNTVELTWNAVELDGKALKYNVYRQVELGDVQKIATVDSTSYTDTVAYDVFDKVNYQISAVVGETESKLSEPKGISDLRNMAGKIDDTDPRVVYTGSWGDWNDNAHYNGTIKYLEHPKGDETASLTFVGTGIKVFVARNRDRGQYEVLIDGQSRGIIDTYNPTQENQYEIFKEENLTYDKHTIVLKAVNKKCEQSTNTKVELDAFEVLDNTVAKPAEIKVSTVSGITVVGAANSQIQMKAEIAPEDAKDKSVVWDTSDKSFATIDENGLLTVNNRNGSVKVTAVSKADPTIKGEVDLTISIANQTEPIVVEVEDSEDKVNPNGNMTWSGNWQTWAGEPQKHHGGTKTECSAAGAFFEYQFTGTGIEVYAHKHANFGSFDVYIDNTLVGTASLNQDATDEPQQLIFAKNDLPNEPHTIKCVIPQDNPKQVNLDYLKVTAPAPENNLVDKTALQQTITNSSMLVKDQYPAEKWAEFETAFTNAVSVMNNMDADKPMVENAQTTLATAVTNLGEPVVKAPVVGSAKGNTILVESSSVFLKWDAVENATSYVVAVEGGQNYPVAKTSFKVEGLTPGETYTFKVYALNGQAQSTDFITIADVTTVKIDKNGPAPVTNIEKVLEGNTVKLSWTAPQDTDLAGYYVFIDGVKVADLTETQYKISNIEKDKTYVVKIVAYDTEKNLSLPEQFTFRVNSDVSVNDIVAVETFNQLAVEYGTTFEQLNLPTTVKVTLTGNLNAELKVVWNSKDYDGQTANVYTLSGDLQLTDGITNTQNLKAEIQVEVKESEGIPNPPIPTVDKQKLELAIWEAERLNLNEYQDGVDKDNFINALKAARTVLNNVDATQEVVNSAKDTLVQMQEKLKKKVTPPVSPTPTPAPNPVTPQTPNQPSKTPNVQTGDMTSMAGLTAILLVSGLAAFVSHKKREDELK